MPFDPLWLVHEAPAMNGIWAQGLFHDTTATTDLPLSTPPQYEAVHNRRISSFQPVRQAPSGRKVSWLVGPSSELAPNVASSPPLPRLALLPCLQPPPPRWRGRLQHSQHYKADRDVSAARNLPDPCPSPNPISCRHKPPSERLQLDGSPSHTRRSIDGAPIPPVNRATQPVSIDSAAAFSQLAPWTPGSSCAPTQLAPAVHAPLKRPSEPACILR
ncbi:hypothetical protein SVAN01_11075 [Stagonosporopsis vannaccii]|nr:hypothetical protein SVAN01_11075 [Stagonosporopsis vannaccii]